MSVVRFHVELSGTGRSLAQRSPTDCDVSEMGIIQDYMLLASKFSRQLRMN